MKIDNDPEAFIERAEISSTWEEAGCQRFVLAGRTDVISAQILNGKLYLAPERSAQHKALIAALGLNAA